MHQHHFVDFFGEIRDVPGVGVLKCEGCGMVKHAQDLRSHVDYSRGSMHDWSKGYNDVLEQPENDRGRRLEAVNRILKSLKPSESFSILDYGCGSGDFIVSLEGVGSDLVGFDPDFKSYEKNRAMHSSILFTDKLDTLQEKSFDLIILFHVLEHFYNPVEELANLKNLLSPGGRILIETPSANDALLTLYACEEFARFTFWSHHPFVYTSKAIEFLAAEAGLKIVTNSQVQRYGLENHLFWLAQGKPGGHDEWRFLSSPTLAKEYEKRLVSLGVADTLWAELSN